MRATFTVFAALFLLGSVAACTKERPRPFRIQSLVPEGREGFEVALFQTTGSKLVPGHALELVNDGRVFDVIADDIRKAQRSVHIVTFIWRPGQASNKVLDALLERARAGVTCRVLVDPLGSKHFEKEVQPKLESAGCKSHFFRPFPANENVARNHRKIVIVDGKVGITGGFGIHDVWLGDADSKDEWRDTNVRVHGPAVVEMQQAFAENWQEASGELLPREDFPWLEHDANCRESHGADATFVTSTPNPEVTNAERVTQLMVQAARKRLWISQSYFTPNAVLKEMLSARARAGVDVRVVAAGDQNDQPQMKVIQRTSYDELLPAGVQIWEYIPSMMHSKTMLIDDDVVVIGSINYDVFSFKYLEEGTLVARDPELARALESSFLLDVQRSKQVNAQAKRQARSR
ncbi:MAG TPA: phospholipase D-like domain-containing protein [Myxococcaceae bacterium]|nr:phospholipase D-like domain-containing protein [Myxococcaceae bacterium]